MFILGGYVLFFTYQLTGNFVLGVVAAGVVVGLAGGALLYGMVWPLLSKSQALPLLATLGLRGDPRFPGLAVGLGYGTAAAGLVLTAVGFGEVPWAVALAAGPTLLLFSAWVVVVGHRLYVRPEGDGTFAFPKLPAGPYTLVAWHPSYGRLTKKVALPRHGDATVALHF